MQTIEKTTLSQLLHNENFNRKVIPFLKSEYFGERSEKILFEEINDFVDKYKNPPTKPALEIEIDKRKDLSEDEHKKVLEFFSNYAPSEAEFSRLPGIDCAKPFFEIRPGTRFFELISIFAPMGLYMDQNRNMLEKVYFRSNFEKRFGAIDS